MSEVTQNLESKITDVDAAIMAAKENKAKRASDPEREAKKAAAAVEREAKKLAAAQKREERAAARVNRPVHMAKVERAAALLPQMSPRATQLFNEITANLPRDMVTALALNLNHFNRVQATQAAADSKLTVGQAVEIIGGAPQFVGLKGTIEKAQRIRCYVNVGQDKLVYLYSSDVKLMESDVAEAV